MLIQKFQRKANARRSITAMWRSRALRASLLASVRLLPHPYDGVCRIGVGGVTRIGDEPYVFRLAAVPETSPVT